MKVTPLMQSNTYNTENDFTKQATMNPIFVRKSEPEPKIPINFQPEIPKETFIQNPFFTDLSTTTTTEKHGDVDRKSEFLQLFWIKPEIAVSKNPFLNGNVAPAKRHNDLSFPNAKVTTPVPLQSKQAEPSRNSSPFSNICGVTVVPNPLVVHGHIVPRGAFPWLVAMFGVTNTGLEYKCSGSLISNKHVITGKSYTYLYQIFEIL